MKIRDPLIAMMFVAFGVFAQVGHAQNELLTFDNLPPATGSIPNGYGGLQWTNFNYIDAVDTGVFGYGLVSSNNVVFNSDGNPAQINDGDGTFNLNSAYLTGGWNDGLQVEVQGFVGGALAYDNTYVVNTTGPTLINFDYLGVNEVNFISSGGTHNPYLAGVGYQFVMDNLDVTLAPEPNTAWLSLCGISMILLYRRRVA